MKCSCSRNQKVLSVYAHEGKLPDDLERVIQECPACRAFYERSVRLSRWVSLCRYEQPDPGWETRVQTRIRHDIQALNDESQAHTLILFGTEISPYRLSMAALLTIFLGMSFIYMTHRADRVGRPVYVVEEPMLEEPSTTVAEAERPASLERPNPEFTPAVFSNFAPRIRQGGPFQFISHE